MIAKTKTKTKTKTQTGPKATATAAHHAGARGQPPLPQPLNLQRGRPAPLRKPGLHALGTQAAKPFGAYGRAIDSQDTGSVGSPTSGALAGVFSRQLDHTGARRAAPPHKKPTPRICAGSSKAEIYMGAELAPYAGRPGAMDAMALPSRMGNSLHYRGGQVVTMPAAQHPARSTMKA